MKSLKGHRWIKNIIDGGHTHLVNVKTGICKSCKAKIIFKKKCAKCRLEWKHTIKEKEQ